MFYVPSSSRTFLFIPLQETNAQNNELIRKLSHELTELKIAYSSSITREETSLTKPSKGEVGCDANITTEKKLQLMSVESLEKENLMLRQKVEEVSFLISSRDKVLEDIKLENLNLKREIKELQEENRTLEKKEKNQYTLFSYLQKQIKGVRKRVDETNSLYAKHKESLSAIQNKHKDMSHRIGSYEDLSKVALQKIEQKDAKLKDYESRMSTIEVDCNRLRQELNAMNVTLEEERKMATRTKKKYDELVASKSQDKAEMEHLITTLNRQMEIIDDKDMRIKELETQYDQVVNKTKIQVDPSTPQREHYIDHDEEVLKLKAEIEVRLSQLKDSEGKHKTLLGQNDLLKKEVCMLKKELLNARSTLQSEIERHKSELLELQKGSVPLQSTPPNSIIKVSKSHTHHQERGLDSIKSGKFSLDNDDMILENEVIEIIPKQAVKAEKRLKCCKEPPYGLVIQCHKCDSSFHAPCVGYNALNTKHKKFICSKCKGPLVKLDRGNSNRKRKSVGKLTLLK